MKYLNPASRAMLAFCVALTLSRCNETEIAIAPSTEQTLKIQSLSTDSTTRIYIVPPRTHVIDGVVLGIKPGDVIALDASTYYGNLFFKNIVGTPEAPVIIKNIGGTATINATGLSFGLKTENCKFFRLTGGDVLYSYGIKIEGGHVGVQLGGLSTNFEVDHIEVSRSGFAGIMAKTDPSCDDATLRENFTMKNVVFHSNYVHDTGGEGFYVGNSFYASGVNTACGLRYPHEIHQLRLYNNIVRNSGWDGIQVGCATVNAKVYGNTVENFGVANTYGQRNGMQLGEGTGGLCYGNYIRQGTGNGMNVLGLGDNLVHDNVISDVGEAGIFCDERYSPGPGFKFINNTIIRPGADGIRIYSELVPMNVIINNVIVAPGNFSKYIYPRTGQDAFVYKLSKTMRIEMSNNFFTIDPNAPGFENIENNYRPKHESPLVNAGADISGYGIATDFYKKKRIKGLACDIGAAELQQ